MGRKKTAVAPGDTQAPPIQTSKNKKKGHVIVDDDEYAIVEQSVDTDQPTSKLQNGNTEVEDEITASFEGMSLSNNKTRGKNNKKGRKDVKVDDDDGAKLEHENAEVGEVQVSFAGKKKGKKGKQLEQDDEDKDGDDRHLLSVDGAEDDNGNVAPFNKNKKKSEGKPKQTDMFSLLAEYEGSADEVDAESTVVESENAVMVLDADESNEFVFSGKKEAKGKKGVIGKEESEFDEVKDAPAEEDDLITFSGKKKGKKSNKDGQKKLDKTIEESVPEGKEEGSDELNELVFTGKKKSKGKKGSSGKQENDFDEVKATPPEEHELITFSGKKKGKKSNRDSQKKLDEHLEFDVPEAMEEDNEAIVFSGKKKTAKGKSNALFTTSAFDAVPVDEEDVWNGEVARNGAEGNNLEDEAKQHEEETALGSEVDEVIQFTGKKKGKKGKKVEKPLQGVVDANMLENDESQKQEIDGTVKEAVPPSDSVVTSKKQKQKKKKSGRTAEEEEDLDKILAELGESPAPPQQTLEEVSRPVPAISESAVAEALLDSVTPESEGPAESAAAKKKKKKKEKEREKKAAASVEEKDVVETKQEKTEDPKAKTTDKKVPKHIKEMQERLARMKEAEVKRKQEEEERKRKEEEEQRILEELERQKEEAKRRKKEREKEKLQKKKQEGKLLTGKQKEEARRLALMREQFLAQSGAPSDFSKEEQSAVVPKKPKYETKKKRRGPIASDAAVGEQARATADHDMQDQNIQQVDNDEVGLMDIQPEMEVKEDKIELEEVEEEDEGEDWDEKSWDEKDVTLTIKSDFAEEEESPVSKNVTKRAVGQSQKLPAVKGTVVPVTMAAHLSMTVAKPATPLRPSPSAKKVQHVPSESEDESESEEAESEGEDTEARRRQETSVKREARMAEALSKRSSDDLRSPICCILGHVDTGKTKLLDCIRRTNVQEGEAGGITQQIGATYFPMENIRERTKELKADANLRVPGLLVIDTPGHESFTNLRARGSGLCDIAILVIDIMHGLEPQTIESLNLLKLRHTPFVVALNKVDRLYGWRTCRNAPIRMALKQQPKDVQSEFEVRLSQIITELKEQGLNSELYYRNKEVRKYISIVPTSAISGEGVPDLLMLLVQLTQKMMEERLMYISEVQTGCGNAIYIGNRRVQKN
eukprot:Gb_22102 [translate_table: standard]